MKDVRKRALFIANEEDVLMLLVRSILILPVRIKESYSFVRNAQRRRRRMINIKRVENTVYIDGIFYRLKDALEAKAAIKLIKIAIKSIVPKAIQVYEGNLCVEEIIEFGEDCKDIDCRDCIKLRIEEL